MKRFFLAGVVLFCAVALTGCFTATGALLGAGIGGLAGGSKVAGWGAAVGAGAGSLVDGYLYHKNPPATGGVSGQLAPGYFPEPRYNYGAQGQYHRGRGDYYRELQRQEERRAYERGRRGY